jgi:membrane-bound lytic murein transglycosylase F
MAIPRRAAWISVVKPQTKRRSQMKCPEKVRAYLHSTFPLLFACVAGIAVPGVLAQARSLDEINQTGEVRSCLVPAPEGFTVEPPECRENCKFSGDLYDLAVAFSQSLGRDVKPKILRVEWDEQFFNTDAQTVREDSYTPELLASGKCDLYPTGMTKLPWREKKLAFVTLYPTRMMVVVNKSRKEEFNTPADLCGKTAATVKNTSWHAWLQAQNETTCAAHPIQIELMTFEESSKALDSGGVDFKMDNFDNTMWLGSPFKNSGAGFAVGPVVEQGWAFRKEDRDLQGAARKFLEGQKAAGDSLWNKQWKAFIGMTLPEYLERVPK